MVPYIHHILSTVMPNFHAVPSHALLSIANKVLFSLLNLSQSSTSRLSLTSYPLGSKNISHISVIVGITVHLNYTHTCLFRPALSIELSMMEMFFIFTDQYSSHMWVISI